MSQKRTRSWEVDVSLEELVSWDVLDQFMGDMPNEPVHPDQSSSSSDAGLGLGVVRAAQLPLQTAAMAAVMAPACGGASSSRQTTAEPPPQQAQPNAASLAQSLYSDWQQGVPWQGALPGVGMPRAISRGRHVQWNWRREAGCPVALAAVGLPSCSKRPACVLAQPSLAQQPSPHAFLTA